MTRLVGKAIFKAVWQLVTRPGDDKKKWDRPMPPEFKTICENYFTLFIATTSIKQSRFALVRCPRANLRLGVIVLSDGGEIAGGEMAYVKSWDITTRAQKVQLVSSNSKQVPPNSETVPRTEMKAAQRGAELLKEITTAIIREGFPIEHIEFALLCIDSQSTIHMIRSWAHTNKIGFRGDVSKIQVAFRDMDTTFGRNGFPNIFDDVVYIDQEQRVGPNNVAGTNFADFLTKVNVHKESPDDWIKKWKLAQDGGWINEDISTWKHLHKGSVGHPADDNRLSVLSVRVSQRSTKTQVKTAIKAPSSLRWNSTRFRDREGAKFRRNKLIYGVIRARTGLNPATAEQDIVDLQQELPRPHVHAGVSKWLAYYGRKDENRLIKMALDAASTDPKLIVDEKEYEDPLFYATKVYTTLGTAAADAFLQTESNGLGRAWKPRTCELAIRAVNLEQNEDNVAPNPLFLSEALKVGQVNPERLRAINPEETNHGRLRSMYQSAGLVVEMANKWRGRAKSAKQEMEPLPPGVDASEDTTFHLAQPEGSINISPLQQDENETDARERREKLGYWALTAENVVDNKWKASSSRHKIIKHLKQATMPYDNGFCIKTIPILLGRETREFNSDKPNEGSAQFVLAVIDSKKPLAAQAVHAAHQEMGCMLSKHTYSDSIIRQGFHVPGGLDLCQTFRDECPSCRVQEAAMKAQDARVKVPGADYTVRETLSQDPMAVIIIDETGPVTFVRGGGGCALMVVELVSGRIHLLGMTSNKTNDLVKTLERLQAIRGGINTIILDAAPSHQVIANAASTTSSGFFIRKKLNDTNIKAKLEKMRIKVCGSNAHHQAGRAENVSKQIKLYVCNVLRGQQVQCGLHYQHLLDIMAGVFNERVKFVDQQGRIHSSNTFMKAALRVSPQQPQDMTTIINTKNKTIIAEVDAVAQETKRILTIFACQYIHSLLAWQVTKFGLVPNLDIGDVVIVLDRVVLHHYRSATRAIGRIVDKSPSGQAVRVAMVSQGPHDKRPETVKHRKHVMLLAKGSGMTDQITHIDPMDDDQVNDFMSQPRLKLQSAFFEAGIEQLPSIQEALNEVKEFEDPDDLLIQDDFVNPMSALDLAYPGEQCLREQIVNERQNVPIDNEPDEQLPPPKRFKLEKDARKPKPARITRHGRHVVKPIRFGINDIYI